jgi:hypothetical protein
MAPNSNLGLDDILVNIKYAAMYDAEHYTFPGRRCTNFLARLTKLMTSLSPYSGSKARHHWYVGNKVYRISLFQKLTCFQEATLV